MQLTIKRFNKETMQIEDVGVSQKWNNDGEQISSLNEWIKKQSPKISKTIKHYANNNAVKIATTICDFDINSLGKLVNKANNCQFNNSLLCILSNSDNYGAGGSFIYPENLNRVVGSYSARSLISSTWLNNNDEYRVPSEEVQLTPEYQQFVNDCYVYSLFSLQSSMRDIPNFDDTTFNIFNHFFFISNEEMKNLADEYNFSDMYQDANEFYEDRYIYTKLQEIELSDDARDILESLRELVRKSMKWRELAHQEDEKFHLHTWDAGWYQIKMGILKQWMPNELKEFMTKFKQFEARLRPLVYQFGFLPYENKI